MARSVGDSDPLAHLAIALAQLRSRRVEVSDSIDEYRPFALEVVREQHCGPGRVELDHRDPGIEGLDRECQPGAQRSGEVARLDSGLTAWHVEEVEALERCHPFANV